MVLFNTFLVMWVLIAIGTFFYLFKTTAPYGRHETSGMGSSDICSIRVDINGKSLGNFNVFARMVYER